MAILQKMTPSLGFYISLADEPLRSRDRRATTTASLRRICVSSKMTQMRGRDAFASSTGLYSGGDVEKAPYVVASCS